MYYICRRETSSADFDGGAIEDIRVTEQIRVSERFVVNEVTEDATEDTPGVGPGQL